MSHYRNRVRALGFSLLFAAAGQGLAKADTQAPAQEVFARVNGEVILKGTYETALRAGGRQRFYHGKAPEAELVAFKQEVAEQLVVERVMHQEAVRRNLSPDQDWVEREFGKIERRYSVSPQWHDAGKALQDQIRAGLAERNLIAQVENAYRQVQEPTTDEVRAYYAQYPDKFTSPERTRVSTILLKVDPWQPRDVWEMREQEANEILAAIDAGADFDHYAQLHPPADQAQLGYLHRGMLGETAQVAIDALQPGQHTGVVTLLEGVAIFRLDERLPAALNAFDKVAQRARELLARERTEQSYAARMKALRDSAVVEFADPTYYETAADVTPLEAAHAPATAAQQQP